MTIPTRMYEPDIQKRSQTKVRIKWKNLLSIETGNSPILSYDLVWDAGNPNSPVNKRLVDSHSYYHDMLLSTISYRFAVRARNKCGYGKFSPVKSIDMM